MKEELISFWKNEFPNFHPQAHALKYDFSDRWVRFHSLPDSKRYSDTQEEYQQILHRHNSILQETCGYRCDIFVSLPEYSENKTPKKPEPEVAQLFPHTQHWYSINQNEEDNDIFYWHLHAAKLQYNGHELNNLLRLVADDIVEDVLVICPSERILYHPYDGGADVILPSTKQRDNIKAKHPDWLSTHPEGY